MCVCTHTHTHTHKNANTHTQTHAYKYTHTQTHTHKHTQTHAQTYADGLIRTGASDAGTNSAYDDDGRGFRSYTIHTYTRKHPPPPPPPPPPTPHNTHTHTLATDFTAEAAKYILYSYFTHSLLNWYILFCRRHGQHYVC